MQIEFVEEALEVCKVSSLCEASPATDYTHEVRKKVVRDDKSK